MSNVFYHNGVFKKKPLALGSFQRRYFIFYYYLQNMWYTFFLSVTFITNLDLYIHACIPSTPHPELVVKHVAALLNLPVQAGFWQKAAVGHQLSPCRAQVPASRRPCPAAGTVLPSTWGFAQKCSLALTVRHPPRSWPPTSLPPAHTRFLLPNHQMWDVSQHRKETGTDGRDSEPLSPQRPALPALARDLCPDKTMGLVFLGFLFCFCFFYFSKKCFFVCDLQSSPLGLPGTHIRSWTLPRPAGL